MNRPQTIIYTFRTTFSEARRMRQEWLEYLQLVSWNNPIALALASSAVGSVVTLAWITARNVRERRSQRRDTALEPALSLESYARTCRTIMHKAAWAAKESADSTGSEAVKTVAVAAFGYPDKLRWNVLSRKVVSELREYPAAVHAAREYVEAFREFGEPNELCGLVEYECAKAAMAALALARATRRQHGAASWKAGAKDSAMERQLSDFIASAEENCETSLQRRTEYPVAWRADAQAFKQALSA
jgi:hypothetical protein